MEESKEGKFRSVIPIVTEKYQEWDEVTGARVATSHAMVTSPGKTQIGKIDRSRSLLMVRVPVRPYVSPSEQAILDLKMAEEEAHRLAEKADNFRELALIDMMNGVLEVRWEDEIKKDIPLPKCMEGRTYTMASGMEEEDVRCGLRKGGGRRLLWPQEGEGRMMWPQEGGMTYDVASGRRDDV
ncbi:unnamed protein product [Timema podura]|uniref:Uncharacterized protein n=1 Tax=Timema podura TaxID=61482 RepID=A0ABN7NPE6_TIMPD|nr:unnamed protein product [Timema podura]